MSSILKALKKLEEEKAERREGSADIARDILRERHRRPRDGWRMPAAAAAAVALVCVGGYLMLRPTVSTAPSVPAEVPMPAVVPQPAVADAAPPTGSREEKPVIQEPQVVEVQLPQGQPAGMAAASKPNPRPPRTASSPVPRPVLPTPVPLAAAPATAAPAPDATETSVAAPHLVLSGIAFHAERDARLAVVNDLPVMEGTVIEGAVVEEILPDRVRFVRAGRTFEVALGKTR